MHGLEGLPAIHAGHGEVHEYQIGSRLGLPEPFQGLQPIPRRQDLQPEGLERGPDGLEDEVLVVHEQDLPLKLT